MKGVPLDKRLVLGVLWLICDVIVEMLSAYPAPSEDDIRQLQDAGRASEAAAAASRHYSQQRAIRQILKAKWLIEQLASRQRYACDEQTLTHL